jgi:uncharacterized protein with HEPN domain
MKKSRRGNIIFPLTPETKAVHARLAELPPLPVPPTVRECAAQGLSPYGFPPSRKSMSPRHTRELIERYPGLYRHADDKPVSSSAPFARVGFECGDGWYGLIDRLSSKIIADPNLVVGQLKKKMGLLTIYFDVGEPADPEIEVATDAAYAEAREESRRTREVCGEPGVYKARGHHIGALCTSSEWLDETEEACRRLLDCAEGLDLPAFAADENRPDAARRYIQRLGEAASHQPPDVRARLPKINWSRLDSVRPVAVVMGMSATEIWNFIRDEVPALAEALQ